ncbi:MAG: hypothetical protein A2Y77_14515 [Planctomycetes bacterium RBG_13_62_9]|nr:MAG: hypothetical protein A2Y77_14515 [Planctomycetes bacterium RBG_13_62_9]
MDTSVIIVSWNARDYLLNCLRSLANPVGHTQEVLVVDNASTDGSGEAVAEQFPQVRLIRNRENVGFARANNIGIKEAKGRYLALINSDVIVLDRCLPRLLAFMDANPEAGICGPRILNPDRTLQARCRHFPTVWNNLCQISGLNRLFPKSSFFSESFMRYWPHDEVRKVDVITGCFWFVRAEAVNGVGLLDDGFFFYGEDVDWCKRFHDAGWDVVFYPHAEAIHFGGGSSRNAPVRFYLELQKADLRYWRKHHGRLGQCSCWSLILLRHLTRIPYDALMFLLCASKRPQAAFKLRRARACLGWLLSGGRHATKSA